MDIKDAAKVLREHNEWRRTCGGTMPHSAADVGLAIDAAVAALEAMAKPVLYVAFSEDGMHIRWWSRTPPPVECSEKKIERFYAGPQPAFCCCSCGMPDLKTQRAAE